MGTRTASPHKMAGGILLGAVTSGLAVTALWGAGTAAATCASISGITAGSGSGGATCTSTGTSFAIANGEGAIATSDGQFNAAIAIGKNATATAQGTNNYAYANGDSTGTYAPFVQFGLPRGTTATAIGTDNRSYATGGDSLALTRGTGNLAVAISDGTRTPNPVLSGTLVVPTPWAGARGINSRAFAIGDGANADAVGIGTTAAALAPGSTALAGKPSFTNVIPFFLVYSPGSPNFPNDLNKGNVAIATHPNGIAGATTNSDNNTAINGNVPFNAPAGTTVINP